MGVTQKLVDEFTRGWLEVVVEVTYAFFLEIPNLDLLWTWYGWAGDTVE